MGHEYVTDPWNMHLDRTQREREPYWQWCKAYQGLIGFNHTAIWVEPEEKTLTCDIFQLVFVLVQVALFTTSCQISKRRSRQ